MGLAGRRDADVTVGPVRRADADAFVAAVLASRTLHHPWIAPPDTPARFAGWLAHLARDDQAAYLVRHRPCGGGLVGYASVANIVRGGLQSAHLGYGAFAGHEGRGLMTEGLRQVVDRCFDELALHRVEANVQPGNARSLAMVRRLGFAKEGFSPRYLFVDGDWRDHERWAVRVETWGEIPLAPGER